MHGAAFTIEDLGPALALGALVVLTAVVAARLSSRSGLPSLLMYLGIGLLLGEGGLGIRFDNDQLMQVLGYVALILILAEGGLSTSWGAIKASVGPAIVLSTLGVLVSVGVVGVAAHLILGLGWAPAFLLGAILSSTDAAAVFSVLRTVPLPHRLTGLLEAESGFNDAPVVMLVIALSEVVAGNASTPWWGIALMAVFELVGGAVIGLGTGYLGGRVIRHFADASSGLFSLGILSLTILAYALASLAHASGFMACYLAALVLGNMKIPHRLAVRGFSQAAGWLAQIWLFVLLGLLADPSRLLDHVWDAVGIGLVLLLLARPLSVLVSMTPFGIALREQAFLSWAGLRGAVPVVLATVPVTSGAKGMDWLFDLVFMLVVVYTLVQAPLLPPVARALRVVDPAAGTDLGIESAPLDDVGATLLRVDIGDDSRMAGIEVFELRLPEGAAVSYVVRGGKGFVPSRSTLLRHGDRLLVVCPVRAREHVENRLVAVSTHGRLAGWLPAPARTA